MNTKNYSDVYIALLSIITSNALVVYGVMYLNWNFFMVIYAYWFGELISSTFDNIKVRVLRKRNELPVMPQQEQDQKGGRFFFLFIYWVFIVAVVGFVTAPSDTYIDNILVILFLNKLFDISILILLIGEFAKFWNSFFIEKNYHPETVVLKSSMMNKRTLIMHISIIFGTFAWFAINTEGFFFKIDAGDFGKFAFIGVFIIIRIVGDLLGLKADLSKK